MAEEKVIASLVGQLKFKADTSILTEFESKLDSVHEKMKQLGTLAAGGLNFKIAINKTQFTEDFKEIAKSKLKLTDVNLDTSAALDKLQEKLDLKKLNIKNVTFRMSDIVEQKKLLRDMMESTTLEVGVLANTRPAWDRLKTFKTNVESHFRIRVNINEVHWANQLLKAKQKMTDRLESTKVTTNLGFKFDKKQLLEEVNAALRSLERKLELRVRIVEGGRGGSGSSGGMFSSRHSMLAGGVAGAAAGKWGRGFIPGLGGAFAIKQVNDINQELQAQSLAIQSVMDKYGGAPAGIAEEKWFTGLADTLGLHKREVMPSYTKMLASGTTSGVSIESVRKIFTGVAAYGQVMGVSGETMAGAMKAVEQMMSKGKVMSEELKEQLAERMPGVMSAMAEAANFGTGPDAVSKLLKAMEDGKVKTNEYMEKFATILLGRTGGSAEDGPLAKSMKQTRSQQNRFFTQWDESIRKFAEAGFDQSIAEKMSIMSDGMRDGEESTKGLGEAFKILTKPVDAALLLFKEGGKALPGWASSLGMSSGQLISMGTIIATNLFPLGRFVTLLSGAALAGQDFLRFLRGQDSEFGKWWANISEEKRTALTNLVDKVGELGKKFAGLAGDVATGMGAVVEWFTGEPSVKLINGAAKIVEAVGGVFEELRKLKNIPSAVEEATSDLFGGAIEKSKRQADYAIYANRLGLPGYSDADRAKGLDLSGMGGYTQSEEQAKAELLSNIGRGLSSFGEDARKRWLERQTQAMANPSKINYQYPYRENGSTIYIQNVTVQDSDEFVRKTQAIVRGTLQQTIDTTVGNFAQQKK